MKIINSISLMLIILVLSTSCNTVVNNSSLQLEGAVWEVLSFDKKNEKLEFTVWYFKDNELGIVHESTGILPLIEYDITPSQDTLKTQVNR